MISRACSRLGSGDGATADGDAPRLLGDDGAAAGPQAASATNATAINEGGRLVDRSRVAGALNDSPNMGHLSMEFVDLR
jgi:hypothetical protein